MRAITGTALALISALALTGCATATPKAIETTSVPHPSATPSGPTVVATPQQIAEAIIYYHCEIGTGPVAVTAIPGSSGQYSVVVKEKLKKSAGGFTHATWLLKIDPQADFYELSQNGDANWSHYACGVLPTSKPQIVVGGAELLKDLIHAPL